jgi:hypothetical protein
MTAQGEPGAVFCHLGIKLRKAAKEDAAAASRINLLSASPTACASLSLYNRAFGDLQNFFPHSAYLLQYLNMASGYDRALSGNPGSNQPYKSLLTFKSFQVRPCYKVVITAL